VKRIKLGRSVSFKNKNEIYVFYVGFRFIFMKGSAAELMSRVLGAINLNGGSLDEEKIPSDFIDYLVKKRIIEVKEVKNVA